MTKIAKNLHNIHDLIKNRWSPRAFSEVNIPEEKIKSLFEAARWAASAFNEQPWRFVYATKNQPELYNQLLNCMIDFNQSWAKTAPMILLTFVKKNFSHDNSVNPTGLFDLGLAVGNLTIQALAMDLYVHHMTGFDPQKAKQTLNISDDYQIVSMMAVGYIGNPDNIPEGIRQNEYTERVRKNIEEFVFNSKL